MNNDMIDAAWRKLRNRLSKQEHKDNKVLRETSAAVIQAALSAVVHKFDPKDKSTWPESELAPSGAPWLCYEVVDGKTFVTGCYFEEGFRDSREAYKVKPFQYLDPADITPEEVK